MGKVVVDLSMSLDGFITSPNPAHEHPLGHGERRPASVPFRTGPPLHDWLFTDESGCRHNKFFKRSAGSREIFDESVEATGAIVVGSRWFDVAHGREGKPPIPIPYFVLTHEVPERWAKEESPFTFVTDGIESALEKARAAAGGKNVVVRGGNVVQQCIKAGLLDEIQIHLLPVLVGEGTRLLDHLGTRQIDLESTRVTESSGVTHFRFRVIKQSTDLPRRSTDRQKLAVTLNGGTIR
jgi:dihydrofolate reductase